MVFSLGRVASLCLEYFVVSSVLFFPTPRRTIPRADVAIHGYHPLNVGITDSILMRYGLLNVLLYGIVPFDVCYDII